MKLIFKFLSIFFFFIFTTNVFSVCEPDFKMPEIPLVSEENENSKNKVYVWYDASLSMSGFTKSQSEGVNLFGPLVNELQRASQSLGTETSYNTFGSRFETIDEDRASLVTTAAFYTCTQSAQACVSKDRINGINKVFNVAKKNTDSTVIIVTDLFLSTSETLAKNAERIKSPLREIFNNGKSIGIFGISSSYNGKVSGIPTKEGEGYSSYSKATKRPFFIIVIGNGQDINFIRSKLEENRKLQDSIAEDPDSYKFTMMTSNVVTQNLNAEKIISENNLVSINSQSEGYKFKYLENLPVYRFKTSEKDYEKEWRKSTRENLVKTQITDDTLSLIFFEDTKLKWGYRWFIIANIFTEKNGSSSQDQFKSWDLDDSNAAEHLQSEPKFFKTLNLMNLIEMINDVANEEFKPTLVASIALNFELEK